MVTLTGQRIIVPQANLEKEVLFLISILKKLTDKAKAEFLADPKMFERVQKRYWGEQLLDPVTNLTYGFFIFNIQNLSMREADWFENPTVKDRQPEFEVAIHLKQNENQFLANMMTSVSIRFTQTEFNEPNINNVNVQFNQGTDTESLITIRDLVKKATPQVTAFDLSPDTITMTQNMEKQDYKTL